MVGGDDDFAIDHSRILVAAKNESLRFIGNHPSPWPDQVEQCPDRPGVGSGLNLFNFVQHGASENGAVAPLGPERFSPEVDAVHVAMAKIHRPLVGLQVTVVLMLRRNCVADGEAARDDSPLRASQWHEIGLCDCRIKVIGGERLPSDDYIDLICLSLKLDTLICPVCAGSSQNGACDQQEQWKTNFAAGHGLTSGNVPRALSSATA